MSTKDKQSRESAFAPLLVFANELSKSFNSRTTDTKSITP